MTESLDFRITIAHDGRGLDVLVDRATGVLFDWSPLAIEEQTNPVSVRLRVGFAPESGVDAATLAQAFADAGMSAEIEVLPPETVDWTEHWKTHFQAFRIGPLWVGPSWETPDSDAQHVLRIDPSMAFGTGLHPSTRLCLAALVDLGPRPDLLDVGTGSGILALASLLMGTEEAVGTDVAPEALQVAADNAHGLGLVDRLSIRPEEPAALGRTFSTVVANILAQPLIQLAPSIASATQPRGKLLLSGILERQTPEVIAAYEQAGFRQRTTRTQGQWALLELERV